MRYNKADLDDTIRVAKIMAYKANKPRFVFATGCGYKIDTQIPPFAIKYMSVNPNGETLLGTGIL